MINYQEKDSLKNSSYSFILSCVNAMFGLWTALGNSFRYRNFALFLSRVFFQNPSSWFSSLSCTGSHFLAQCRWACQCTQTPEGAMSTGQAHSSGAQWQDGGHKLKLRSFHLNMKNNCFTVRVTELWNRLPRELLESPSTQELS